MPKNHQWATGELAKLWVQAGGNKKYAYFAAAVAWAESGGYDLARNPKTGDYPNGAGHDEGLWQINSFYHPMDATFDPLGNARAAVKISSNGTSWKGWCTAWSDNACGSKGGTYLGSTSSAVNIYADLGGNADPGSAIWANPPSQNDPRSGGGMLGIHPPGDKNKPPAKPPCRHSIDLKVGKICTDKLIAGAVMTAGGILVVAGVAVIAAVALEQTPAGRAATKAIAVTGAGAAVTRRGAGKVAAQAPAARQERRTAAEQTRQAAEARRTAPTRQAAAQDAAEARRQAAEARRRTQHRRQGRAAAANERRAAEVHQARMIREGMRSKAAAGRPAGRSYRFDELDGPRRSSSRATRHAALPPGSPPPF